MCSIDTVTTSSELVHYKIWNEILHSNLVLAFTETEKVDMFEKTVTMTQINEDQIHFYGSTGQTHTCNNIIN